MANVSSEQLAQLLLGIARAQNAIVEAVDRIKPGFKMTHFAPTLQTAARVREFGRVVTLVDLPVRILTDYQRRGGPDIGQIQKELEALLEPAAGTDGAGSLDFSSSSS
jgi:hypothetical protein